MKKSSSKKAASKAPAKASANKTVSRKTVSKKANAKGQVSPAGPAKKTAAAKPAANRRTINRKTVSKKAAARKAAVPVEELPTEEIWAHYQKARKKTDAQAVEHIRNILMERHFPLVKYIAERLLQTLPKSIELDDLVSAGLFGLMDAIRGFDPDRGIKFKTYCTTRIRGSILDQLRSQDWVPRLVRLKASRIDKALQRLTGLYGREPTHSELAKELEMDHQELSKELQGASAKAMYSLSDKWEDRDDDSSMEKVDVLEDKKSIDPLGVLNREDMMGFLTRSLTHKEQFIIEQYYQVGHTMREIGEMLNLTESRVCQIHSNVMGRLKSLFGTKQNTMLM
ncbi:MAG: FliA/WhiG family RNA polymerase sigma factor [Planctomycetota bacterium]|nr:FliA/WhiG family RNA polymerase sigma factor [Planctomycetota bacterium]